MKKPGELFILKEMPYTLLSFLIKHKALRKFIRNAHEYFHNWNVKELQLTVKLRSTHAIDLCFCWANTPEGHDYWSKLNQIYIITHE